MARVLVGVDGSELALRAAKRALEILGPAADDVTIVRVVQPVAPIAAVPTGGVTGAAMMSPDTITASNDAMLDDARTAMDDIAGQLGVEAATEVVLGDPGAELCRLAADADVDLVVVGSHGSGFLKRVLLGSVSHHVLHHAPCPVMVVRDGGPEGTGT